MSFWQVLLLSSLLFVLFIIIGVLIYSFVVRRNMKTQHQKFTKLHQSLTKGQYVEFSNGLFGTLVSVGEETCDIELKSGAVITVSRYTISAIIN